MPKIGLVVICTIELLVHYEFFIQAIVLKRFSILAMGTKSSAIYINKNL